MTNNKEIQELISDVNNNYSIDELKQIYKSVDMSQEVVVAKTEGIKHIFYRNKDTRKLQIDRNLLQYDRVLQDIKQHEYYPFDLCNLTFYDDIINRYGNGIIIPRLKKFVMINNMNLIREPSSSSFYTIGIDEDNRNCDSIADRMGNIYRIYSDEGKNCFNIHAIYKFNYKRFLMYDYYGFLVEYKDRPVFANICEPPYMILDKETLMKFCTDVCIDHMDENSYSYLEKFDDEFMQGKSYVK